MSVDPLDSLHAWAEATHQLILFERPPHLAIVRPNHPVSTTPEDTKRRIAVVFETAETLGTAEAMERWRLAVLWKHRAAPRRRSLVLFVPRKMDQGALMTPYREEVSVIVGCPYERGTKNWGA